MEEIVVAKPDRFMVGIVATLALFVVSSQLPDLVRIVLIVVAGWGIYRLIRMKVAVTPESVVVVNLTGRAELALDEVRIVDERPNERTDLAAGSDGAGVRTLILTDDSGRNVKVGRAPVLGSSLDDVAGRLHRAVAAMRARS